MEVIFIFKIKAQDGSNNLCGKRLAKIRKKRGLSQRGLAKKLELEGYEVDHHFIRRIETGERFVIDIELDILVKVLDVTIEELIKHD